MPASRAQTGYVFSSWARFTDSHLESTRHITGNDCDVYTTNNAGCGVQAPTPPSYGPAFNNAGGGWYAVERTDTFIKVWFWNREVPGTPGDVANGAGSVNTDNWVRTSFSPWPEGFYANTSNVLLGPAVCLLPEHVVRLPEPLRADEHHHQPHPL